MKIKLGQFELIIHKCDNRPTWSKSALGVLAPIEKTKEVIKYACYLYSLVQDDLATGMKHGDLPDCRKLISRTLADMGYSEHQIAVRYGHYLGQRITIHSQIASSRLLDNEWNKVFRDNLKAMRCKFVEK